MPLAIQQKITKCKTVGRCGTGQVKAVFIHEDSRDIGTIVADMKACCASSRACNSSYHYVIDPVACRVWRFVQEADTAWSFNWDDPLNPFQCNPCPPGVLPTCDPCALPATDPILVGEPVGSDPNCFAIHIALAIGSQTVPFFKRTPLCPTDEEIDPDADCPAESRIPACTYSALVELLQGIAVRFPALPIDADTIRRAFCDLPDLDLAQLIIDVNTPVVPVVPFNRLCSDLGAFPVGSAVTFYGTDIDGLCVSSPGTSGAPPTQAQVIAALSGVPTGAPAVLGTTLLYGSDGQYHVVPTPNAAQLCAVISVYPVGAASAGPFLGTDCQFHAVSFPSASICTALNGIAAGVSAPGDTIIALNGGACKVITLPSAAISNYRVTQALASGNNTITHSLGLVAPFTSVVQVRDAATGALITANVINETANDLVVNVGAAVASAIISVVA